MAKAASQHIRTISKQTGIVVGRVQEIALSTNEQSMAATVMAQSAEKLSLMAEEGKRSDFRTRSVIDGINTLARARCAKWSRVSSLDPEFTTPARTPRTNRCSADAHIGAVAFIRTLWLEPE